MSTWVLVLWIYGGVPGVGHAPAQSAVAMEKVEGYTSRENCLEQANKLLAAMNDVGSQKSRFGFCLEVK